MSRDPQPPVSDIPQPKGADPLGQRPFDTQAPFLALLPFCTAVPGSCRLQRLKCRLRPERQTPGDLRRLCAERPRATGSAVLPVKAHLNVQSARGFDPLWPAGGGFSLRTVHLPALLIHTRPPRVTSGLIDLRTVYDTNAT